MLSSKKKSEKVSVSLSVRLVQQVSDLIDRIAVIVLVLLCAYGIYGMWDTNQVLSNAQSSNLQQYKPEATESHSFQELKEINQEVIAWLTVYGTKIDYPITQGENDQKYVNTDVMGKYSLAGSIFLASENAADFSDFNSIIYGHHMDKEAMFGGLDKFRGKKYFDRHQYGNLYYEGKDYGIEFFAFIQGDAYDWQLYKPGIEERFARESYLAYLTEQANRTRSIEVNAEDRIVLLSTCASEPTNGRHILVGKLYDTPFADPFYKEKEEKSFLGIDVQSWWKKIKSLPLWVWGLLLICWLLLLTLWFLRRRDREGNK
ncbi:class B sortase [Enterococcus sp. DIV0756]|uniref:class B sortase n=1 Tax=Enterococcus sp. DIV0756 TaxID=2774636 RepID=UPI003F26C7F7